LPEIKILQKDADFKKGQASWALVVYACNHNYTGGRVQEVGGPPRQILAETYLENTQHKKGLVEWLKL
jgi:hypothetical protein